MNKKKNIIIVVTSIIIILILVALIVIYAINYNKSSDGNRVNKLYDSLKNEASYGINLIYNDENKEYYAKDDKKAYINSTYNNVENKYIIKEGSTYLLKDSNKTAYKYENNEVYLYKVEVALSDMLENHEKTTGKEKIENKEYSYEEFNGISDLYMYTIDDKEEVDNAVTRFYFKGDKLVYIKTIINDKQELLKVDISKNIDKKLFDIPSDYKEM